MDSDIEATIKKVQDRVFPTLLKGLTVVCKEKPEDPIRFLAYWLIENNPYKPRSVSTADPPKIEEAH